MIKSQLAARLYSAISIRLYAENFCRQGYYELGAGDLSQNGPNLPPSPAPMTFHRFLAVAASVRDSGPRKTYLASGQRALAWQPALRAGLD